MTRKATLKDIDALSLLFDQYRIFYRKKSDVAAAKRFLTERIERKESVIYVSHTDEKVMTGFVQLYPIFSSTRMKRLWLLNDLFVDAAYRRQGYSTALIEAAKTLCKESASCGMFLETEKTNAEGRQLYPKTGFQLEEAHDYYFWDG